MQGTIVKIAVEEGQVVEAGELVVVLEAMKMEQPINAHKAGTITGLTATVGVTVTNGLRDRRDQGLNRRSRCDQRRLSDSRSASDENTQSLECRRRAASAIEPDSDG